MLPTAASGKETIVIKVLETDLIEKYRNPKMNLQMDDQPIFSYDEVGEDVLGDVEDQVHPSNVVYTGFDGNFELGDLEANELIFDEEENKKV